MGREEREDMVERKGEVYKGEREKERERTENSELRIFIE